MASRAEAGGRNRSGLQGDTGYDSEPVRQLLLRWLGITPILGKRGREHGSGLGYARWFVERTIAWLHSFGRLRRRLDRLTRTPKEAFTSDWLVTSFV